MTGQGNATAGSRDGDANFETALDRAAAEARQAAAETAEMPQDLQEPAFSIFGQGQSEAEDYLYAYLDRARMARTGGFAPYEQLSARLNELAPSSLQRNPEPRDDGQGLAETNAKEITGNLLWIEHKFDELRRLLSEDARREIVNIEAKLGEIINRVDRLSAAMPGEKTMVAVETQLSMLSRSLALTREQASADADRISRAANEILAATGAAEKARAGFEAAARHTIKELGETVAVTASRAAAGTAKKIVDLLELSEQRGRLVGLHEQVTALTSQSRASASQTEAAVERMHQTLQAFLEKGQAGGQPAGGSAQKQRAAIHMPISADAPVYAQGGFGSIRETKPRLESITRRGGPSVIDALRAVDQRLAGSEEHPLRGYPQEEEWESQEAALRFSPGGQERNLPLLGIGIVTTVLLLASAALFYLHTRSPLVPFHMSVLPQIQATQLAANRLVEHGSQTADTASAVREFPALFTAAEQNRQAANSDAVSGEDLHSLTVAASQGDREAQFRIGARFLSEDGLASDPATAARWLERAAEQNHTESQFVLASLYERGVGVPKDTARAIDLYRRAARGGHLRAMHNLAVLLAAREMAGDMEEAAGWFLQAASAGLTDSQYNLALLYERGLGLEENREKAYFWYEVAARSGDKEAAIRAEALRRELPLSETQTVAAQASAWRPKIEDAQSNAGRDARS